MPVYLKTLTMTARAKINLSLNVLGQRADGYHTIESVMQPLAFGDTVSVTLNRTGHINLTTDAQALPTDERNIAYRAAQLMLERAEPGVGVVIHIKKRIPIAAGLAGGSTNAAAVLCLMNRLLELQMSTEALASLGLMLGADVPFCLYERPMLAEGIGEKLTPVHGLADCYVVLVNPGVSVSTAAIYKEMDSAPPTAQSQTQKLLTALASHSMASATQEMINMMQPVAIRHCPAIQTLLDELRAAGAQHAMMSGSGATCFGVFEKKPKKEELVARLGKQFVALSTPYSTQ